MNHKLPALRTLELIRKLRTAGFVFDRHAKGSHEIWYHPDSRRRTTIPHHSGRNVATGTLRAIIRQTGLTLEEFIDL